MAKKVTIVLTCVLLVLAALLAVAFLLPTKVDNDNALQTENTTEVEEQVYLDEDLSDDEYIEDDSDTEQSDDDNKDDFTPSDELLSDNTDDVISTNFTISRIVDHTTNQQVHPRVVFGSGYNANENYIKFDTLGNFEMYLSGYFNNTKTGTYKVFDDIIYVEYSDSTAAEYDIKYDDSGVISYIIVNYGDYDIYFA